MKMTDKQKDVLQRIQSLTKIDVSVVAAAVKRNCIRLDMAAFDGNARNQVERIGLEYGLFRTDRSNNSKTFYLTF